MNTKTKDTTAVTLQHSNPHSVTTEEAKDLDHKAIQTFKEMKRSWLSLGLVMKRVSETRAFERLGFRSMRAWVESRFREQVASAYQAMRAVKALDGVPESKLEKIGTRNAQVLVRLPDRERRSDVWITKAATLPERELRAEVDALIEGKTHMPKEKFRYWGEAVPESVAEKLDEMMAKIERVLEVDVSERPGRITALEALAATILNTADEQLKVETVGDEEQYCSFAKMSAPTNCEEATAGDRR